MFKHKFYKVVLLTVIAVSTCSCNKYLALSPQDGLTKDTFWQSKEQLLSAVIGIYSGLCVNNGVKAPAEDFFVWGELRADFIVPGPGITNDETNAIEDNILSSNGVANWTPIYRVINLCNAVLDFGPGVKNVDNTLTQAQLNSYLSEALTIRALMYFYLVRSFGDVPLKLKSTSLDTDLQQLTKTAQKDVLAQIVADLKTAEGYATITYGDNATNKGRVTKWTVNALQADVYLWMDDYANCITACDKVINSGLFGLVAGDGAWFNNLYAVGNSAESIFELQFDASNLNPYWLLFQNLPKPRYLGDVNIVQNFYTVDPAGILNDIRGVGTAINVGDATIQKYAVSAINVSYRHWIFYRYADILLMKAEACANASRGADALTLINTVRTRAGALPSSALSPDPSDVNGLTDYIMAERGREFAFEGKRWYDLLRNAKRNNYARIDILITAAVESVPPLYKTSAINKLKDPNSLYFPIYFTELQNDPNLVQNSFYK